MQFFRGVAEAPLGVGRCLLGGKGQRAPPQARSPLMLHSLVLSAPSRPCSSLLQVAQPDKRTAVHRRKVANYY